MAKSSGKENVVCDILEEIVQCPVCLEIPHSPVMVYQCTIGHHICSFCKNRLAVCPTCRSPFSETRNFACEDLLNKFEFIKSYIEHAMHEREKIVNRSIVSVNTQTERSCNTAMTTRYTQTVKNMPEPTVKKQSSTLTIAKGSYYCCIGSCTIKDTHTKLMWHVKTNHKDTFFEFPPTDDGTFTKNLIIDNTLPRDYDYAFLIGNMGLFFVHFSILYTGDFEAYVQLANSPNASSDFKYILTLGSATCLVKHHGQVYTCRERIQPANIFCMPEHSMIRMTNGKPFKCGITIKRETKVAQPVKMLESNQDIDTDLLHSLISQLR